MSSKDVQLPYNSATQVTKDSYLYGFRARAHEVSVTVETLDRGREREEEVGRGMMISSERHEAPFGSLGCSHL